MRKVLTKTFFKFFFGFVTILALSFAIIIAAGIAQEVEQGGELAAPIKAVEPGREPRWIP